MRVLVLVALIVFVVAFFVGAIVWNLRSSDRRFAPTGALQWAATVALAVLALYVVVGTTIAITS